MADPQPETPVADKPPEIARFAQVVAHELRNPLSAVKIALQTLERHGSLAEKDGLRLAIALREVGTIEGVLNEILEWARPGELAKKPASAREVIDDALLVARPVLEERRVHVTREPLAEALPLEVDRPRMARALAELVKNAAQASEEGAALTLRVSREEDAVRIDVEDRGPGFAEADLERAFEPFFTRRARGIGLGLCRARQMARRHGGDVVLASSTSGTRARLSLPEGGRA